MKAKKAAVGAAILMFSIFILTACGGEPKDGKYAELAKCLTSKGVIFYGAYWCAHCINQKKTFGDDIRYINYVECDPKGQNSKTEECRKAGVERYPSWFFPGQGLITGEMKPEEVAQKANCLDAGADTQATEAAGTTVPATAAPTGTATQATAETSAPAAPTTASTTTAETST